MANIGFFLGGVSKGINEARQLSQQDKQIKLRERALSMESDNARSQQTQRLIEAARKNVVSLLGDVKMLVEGARAAGASDEQIKSSSGFVSLVNAAKTLAQKIGDDPSFIESRANSLLTAIPSATARARTEGEAAGAKAVSQIDTLVSSGASREQALKAAGLSSPPIRPVEVFDPNSPTGTRLLSPEEALGRPGKPPSGIEITSPDGTTIRTGVRGSGDKSGLAKKTINTIENKLLQTTQGLDRIASIKAAFQPRFLEIGTKFETALAAGKNKLGIELSPDETQLLTDFTVFKRRTVENLNLVVRDLSGAAVTAQEAERLRAALPDVGDGIFSGDSPVSFQAKLNDVFRALNLAKARLVFAREQGLSGDIDRIAKNLPLDMVEQQIEREGQLIEAIVREENPGAPQSAIDADVRVRLANRFGLSF